MDFKARAAQLKKEIPAVFLALKRKDTPVLAKALAAITVAYALSPIDLIPDFIPILGYLDDLLVLPLLVALTIKAIPAEVMVECRIDTETTRVDDTPKKWYCAIPIVLLWLLILWLIVKAIWF